LGQLTQSVVREFVGEHNEGPEQDMDFFREHRLAADDPRRERVYDYYRRNLEDLCGVARSAGAQMVLATVPVNLVDFPPLASLARSGLSSVEREDWQRAWAKGTQAEAAGRWGEALTHYSTAVGIDDHHAELHFRLARCASKAGSADLAKLHYALARDWDALPFRADNRLNDILRQVVTDREDDGVRWVDVERLLAEKSGAAGLDSRFFQEHVHFNFAGDYAVAESLMPAVAAALELNIRGDSRETGSHDLPTRQRCAEVLAFTAWDAIGVRAAILRMTAKAPFLDQLDHATRQGEAEQAVQRRIGAFTQRDYQTAVETYENALRRRPRDWQIHENYGALRSDFGDLAGAASQYAVALDLMPRHPPLRLRLAQFYLRQGKRAQAIREVREILRWAPDYGPARTALADLSRPR
jgi:tetratricopeptide (TPR) repeat protein